MDNVHLFIIGAMFLILSFYMGVRWERYRIIQVVIRIINQFNKKPTTPKEIQLRLELIDGVFYAYDDKDKFYGQGANRAELVSAIYRDGFDISYTIDINSMKLLKEHDDTI